MKSVNIRTRFSFSEWIDTLNEISEGILMNEDLDITTGAIMAILKDQIHAVASCYLTIDDESQCLVLHSYTKSKFINLLPVIPYDIYAIRYPLSDQRVFITQCMQKNQIMQSPKMRDFFFPIVKSARLLDTIQAVIRAKLCIGIPVSIKGKPKGVYFVVTKKTKLTPSEIKLLRFYANFSAIALDNNEKMKQLREKYELEKTTTSILSHELKTPIAIAHNSSQMLKFAIGKRGEHISDTLHDIEAINADIDTSIRRLNSICTSIFDMMDTENKDLSLTQKLDLERQLEQVLLNFSRRAKEKNLAFSAEFDIESGTHYGGGIQLEQIATILLDNAVKYTPDGSISLLVRLKKGKIRCEVSDTGPGIPVRKREAVFERFYRYRSLANRNLHKIEGLGLGLYVARKIVEKLGGKISIEDNENRKGIRFVVEIPVQRRMAQRAE